ncbi:MAG: hypothetical protein Q9187_005848 [Circinaria calcarea]
MPVLTKVIDLTTLDGLVKISHFPALRKRFTIAFGEIHQSQQQRWGVLVEKGFRVFDFEEVLRTRERSRDSQASSPMSDFELPELTHSNAFSTPLREPIDIHEQHSTRSNNEVLGKRPRTTDSSSLSVTTTPIIRTERGVARGWLRDGSVPYGNNSINHGNLIDGIDEPLDPYIFDDPLNNFAFPQSQDFDMLFQTEFDNSLLGQA